MIQDKPTRGVTKTLKPSTTSREILYTTPNNITGFVTCVIMANDNASADVMKFEIYDSSASTYFVVFNQDVAGNDSFVFSEGTLVLEKGDQLVLTATNADRVSVTVTVEEYRDISRSGV